MIKPAPEKTRALSVILTADIETDKKGHLLDVNLAYNLPSGPEYRTCRTWLEWFDAILEARILAQKHKLKLGHIWFHNGGGFDIVELTKQLLKRAYEPAISYHSCKIIGGVILELTITFARDQHDFLIRIADSYRVLPGRLADLCGPKGFNLPIGKDKVPSEYLSDMGRYRANFPAEYHEYHRKDTVLLLELLHQYRDILNTIAKIGDLRLTVASTALAVFKTGFLEHEIITPSKQEAAFSYLAYQGGRTEFVGDGGPDPGKTATFSNVHQWDANSHYPSCMMDMLFPIRPGVYTKSQASMRASDGSFMHGVYRATYSQRHGRIAILKPKKADGTVTKEAAWSGETYLTHIELNEIEKNGGTVTALEGYVYPPETLVPLFASFVDRLYTRRLQAAAEGNVSLVYVIKLLMNNLYGKFAERPISETLTFLTTEELTVLLDRSKTEAGIALRPLPDLSDDAYTVTEPRDVPNAFPAIAAFITAEGRLRLMRMANDHNVPIIYMDTDSVHTRAAMPPAFCDPTRLGAFKLESAKYPLGVTEVIAGRKAYVSLTANKAVCKGAPQSCINPSSLANAIENGTPYIVDYTSPSKIKTALKQGEVSANEFLNYSRTINRSPSSYAQGLLR